MLKPRTGLVVISLAASVLLGACSKHENPLMTGDRTETGKFLADASHAAVHQLKLKSDHASSYYGDCMTGKTKASCTKLFQAMVTYAKTQYNYKTVTVSDLTDQHMYRTVHEYYDGAAFDRLD